MKKLLIVTAVATTSVAHAFDYKINLEGRADLVNSNVKTTTVPGGVKTTDKYNNFSNGLIRFNMFGQVNDSLSYRFRYRFLTAGAAPSAAARENVNTGNGVDFLYLDHKNSIFTTRVGKQSWVESAGRESIVSGTDVFLTSLALSNFRSTTALPNIGGEYRYGVSAMFKFMDTNNLSIALSNPNTTFTDTAGAERKNTGIAMGAYYTGSFMDKLIQPVLGYTRAKQNADTDAAAGAITKDADFILMAAGLRSEFAGVIVDADYKEYKKENRNGAGTAAATFPQQKSTSIYGNVAYPIGAFTPMVTYINDKFESETATANFKRNSFAVGTYWKPFADVNFRYHAMFTSAQTKADGAASTANKVDDKKIYLGFKADI